MKVIVALTLLASASATVWWTPPSGPVCVSDWWPYTCSAHGGDEAGVCVGYDRYQNIAECAGTTDDTEFEGPQGPICVTSWWPYQCDMHAGNESVCVGYDRYDSLQACGVETAGSSGTTDGYCVTSWWDPHSCERISSGNCIGWYPAGGYETENECLGKPETNDTDTTPPACTFNCGDFCVTNWWPHRCGMAMDNGTNMCAGWTRYDTEAECCGNGNPECSSTYVAPSPGPLGYCVESYWPKSCTTIASGNCLPNSWYPGSEYLGDGRGWATEASCISGGTKSFKHPVNINKQIDALKTIEVLKLTTAWAKETAKRASVEV